ncbi:AraC family transcriptional regulator [Opitutaceae bacterium EW11]|nr:AraC family transcriptional regulator [Opitutaceae bacterium EW11]
MPTVRHETLQDYHERLYRVLLHIDQHRSESLSLDELAGIACLSPYHFHRIFRAFVGETLGRYVQRVRLETAAVQLQTTAKSVTDIALDAGYESAAGFSRAFEERFGMAPTECRKAHRLELQVRSAQLKTQAMIASIAPDIRQRPDTRVAFVRHTGPYAKVGAAWDKLCAYAGAHRLFGPNTAMIGIGHDAPKVTAEDRTRYDACLTVNDAFKPEGEIGVQTIPGGRYAVFVHQGPYDRLSETYDRIFRDWLPGSGETLRDQPAFEVYVTPPDRTPPDQLRTEIWVPLK